MNGSWSEFPKILKSEQPPPPLPLSLSLTLRYPEPRKDTLKPSTTANAKCCAVTGSFRKRSMDVGMASTRLTL